MATFQRLTITLLVVLAAVFLFFAQTGEAAKGPRITHKVYFDIVCVEQSATVNKRLPA